MAHRRVDGEGGRESFLLGADTCNTRNVHTDKRAELPWEGFSHHSRGSGLKCECGKLHKTS